MMDRAFAKWIVYVAIGLVAVYGWIHLDWIRTEVNRLVIDWWH